MQWTKLFCRTFKDNQTRLQLFALAYNLGNFMRRLAPSPPRIAACLEWKTEKRSKSSHALDTRGGDVKMGSD